MKKIKAGKVLITLIVVIIGIAGISWFTFHLGKMFVGLVSANTTVNPGKAEQPGSEILTLPKIDLWTCQVGVFNDKKNADKLVDAMQAKGWKAEIITEEAPYTVAVGAFTNRETAVLLSHDLMGKGIQALIQAESFPALHYKVSGRNVEKITTMLKTANSLLNGTARDQVQKELAGDMEAFLSGECPTDFQRLNLTLGQIFHKKYPNEGSDFVYKEDLLDLFAGYKSITTKYFKNDK
jgi:hypothetical protein